MRLRSNKTYIVFAMFSITYIKNNAVSQQPVTKSQTTSSRIGEHGSQNIVHDSQHGNCHVLY